MARKIGTLLTLVILLATASAALAGGWAVVTLDAPPGEIRAGEAWAVGFTVLQHGQMPVHKLDATTPVQPLLMARNLDAGRRVEVLATPTDEVGHFTAEVTFPVEGEWTWTILPNPLAGNTAFEPLTVLPPAPPPATANAAAQPAAAFALSPADGLRWATVAVAGLAVVVALLQARKRVAARPQADS